MISMMFPDSIVIFVLAVMLCRLLVDVDNAVRRDNNTISGAVGIAIAFGIGLTLAVAVISAIETIKQIGAFQ